jgi:DNA-binding NarL/FixJ family response regulator
MMATETANLDRRPRLVLAHRRADYASSVCRFYGRLGWETHRAASAREARTLARCLAPAVVVLGTDLPDESGWLTCEKLLHERPGQKVVLVADRLTPATRQFAAFVGAAALIREEAGVEALADEVG